MVETVIYSWWETTGQPNFENQIKFLRSKSGKVLRIDHTYKAVKSLGVSTPIKKKSIEKTDSAQNADSGQDPSQKSDIHQKSDTDHQPNWKSKKKKKKPKYNWVNKSYFWVLMKLRFQLELPYFWY